MLINLSAEQGIGYVERDDYSRKTLELVIIDFCNLDCKFCAQSVPYMENKKLTSFDELVEMSKYFKPHEFHTIKISGGEPTTHHDFGRICENLSELFPATWYVLATNGVLLQKHLDAIKHFSYIDLAHYPGFNDKVCAEINELQLPNLVCKTMDDEAMVNIFEEKNIGKKDIFRTCSIYFAPKVIKMVQGRLYPCCNIFGLSVTRDHVDAENISVEIDAHWRENLNRVDIEPYCPSCFYDVIDPASALPTKK